MKNKIKLILPAFLLITAFVFIFVPIIRLPVRSFCLAALTRTIGSLHKLGNSIEAKSSFIIHIGDLKRKNDELSEQLIGLQVDKSRIEELQYENSLLKKELGFVDDAGNTTLIPAHVIERDPVAFLDHLTIDRGSEDGIKNGNPVIFSGVLVGQISEVTPHNATVILITSKDSIIQAMLQDCRAKGILRGGLSGLYIENVMRDTEYKEGEFVVTSGLGGKMREGILIGRAKELESPTSGIFKTISVESLVDLSKLELVFIEQ